MPESRRFLSKLRGGRLILAVVLVLGLLAVTGRLAAGAYVEVLWQNNAGFAGVFWERMIWEWGARLVAGVAVGLVVFANLRLVSRTLSGIQIKRRFGNIEISEQLPHRYLFWAMVVTSVLLGSWFGAAVPSSVGLQMLLLAKGAAWGMRDPILGKDIGFYVFGLPVLGSVVTFGFIVAFLIFSLVASGYAATGVLRWGRGRVVAHSLPRLHLGAILAAFLLLLAGRMWLGRYLALLHGTSGVQGIFGYVDAQARLPALQTMTILCVAAAAGVIWGSWKNRGWPIVVSIVSLVVASIVILGLYPAFVERFRVEPNELERETPYIRDNLTYTRQGFGLDRMERRPFPYRPEEHVDWSLASRQFAGLPVWNQNALLTTFRQIEARYPYYDFHEVTIDRYPGPDGLTPVALSAREVDPSGIKDPNWQNLHLRELYIEGAGAVASLAARRTPEGGPLMVISGISPDTIVSASRGAVSTSLDTTALRLTRPQVFFGSREEPYAVVNASASQFLAPGGGPGKVGVDYPAGILLSSKLRTLALAWSFQDPNLLFSSEISPTSRFVYRRSIVDRVEAVAPFLRFPEPPYPVITDGHIVWILDGFTATRAYPLSKPSYQLQFMRPVSYVRNSVKVTIDAVSGAMHFYRVPVHDPLADAYESAFPGLFEPIDSMPVLLRHHLRYPRDLMNVQAQVLLQYHQETAPAFHRQQDVWAIPHELAQGTSPVPYRPEYGLYRLPGEDSVHFNLTTVFIPAGRQNLTAMLVARTDDRGVPTLKLYDVAADDQVPGPRQVEALVEQDPHISQQFSLWRTGGSNVWTGHLHLVPVDGRLVYMEPVFLAAAADAIPELRRYVVSDGRRVAFTSDLAAAVAELAGRSSAPVASASAQEAAPSGPEPAAGWPSTALDLLDSANARLRRGEWQAYGDALARLRSLLEKLKQGGTGSRR